MPFVLHLSCCVSLKPVFWCSVNATCGYFKEIGGYLQFLTQSTEQIEMGCSQIVNKCQNFI